MVKPPACRMRIKLMHSMRSFPAALIPLVHLFLPHLLHVIMDALIVYIVYQRRDLWATQVSRYNQSKWAWWYLCLYVEINSQCNCSITYTIIQLLHCMWPSSNQLENFFVVPIPKIPRASSTSDCRPISLLSILSKVLECHFHLL